MWILNEIFNFKKHKNKFVITIDGEYGSDFLNISKKIGEKLSIPVYDENLLELKVLESSLSVENLNKDTTFLQKTIYDLYRENYSYSQENINPTDARFLTMSKYIRDLYKNENCLIIGNCSNYVLRKEKNVFNVFIHANENFKYKNIIKKENYTKDKAILIMEKKDSTKRNHYNKYTNSTWGAANNYDLSICSNKFKLEDIVEIIIKCLEKEIDNMNN